MITVIGTKNCGKCEQVKAALDAKGVEYEYKSIEELTMEEVTNISRKGCRSMPILIVGDCVKTLEEVLK